MNLTSKQKSRSMKLIREAKRYSGKLIDKVLLSQILNIIIEKKSQSSARKSTSALKNNMRSSSKSFITSSITPRVSNNFGQRKISTYTTNTNISRRNDGMIKTRVRVNSEGVSYSYNDGCSDKLAKSRVISDVKTPVGENRVEGQNYGYEYYGDFNRNSVEGDKSKTEKKVYNSKLANERSPNELSRRMKRGEEEPETVKVKKTITEKTEYLPERYICVSNQTIMSPPVVHTTIGPLGSTTVRHFSPPVVCHQRVSVSPVAGVSRISTKVVRTEEVEVPNLNKDKIDFLNERVNELIFKNFLKLLTEKNQNKKYSTFSKLKKNAKIILQNEQEANNLPVRQDLSLKFKGILLQKISRKYLWKKNLNKYLQNWDTYCKRFNKRRERDLAIICSKSRMERFTKILENYVENRPLKNSYHAFNKISIYCIWKQLRDVEEIEIVKGLFDKIKQKQNIKKLISFKELQYFSNVKKKNLEIDHHKNMVMESIEIFKNKTEKNIKTIIDGQRNLRITNTVQILNRKIENLKRDGFSKIKSKNGKISKMGILFEKLGSSTKSKILDTFSQLKIFNKKYDYEKFKEESKIEKLGLITEFLKDKKKKSEIQKCFSMMKSFSLNSKTRKINKTSKTKQLLENLIQNFSTKKSQAFQKMTLNSLSHSKSMLNAFKIEKIISNKFKKHAYYSFNEIIKSAYKYKEAYKFASILDKVFLKNFRSTFDKIDLLSEHKRLKKIKLGMVKLEKIFTLKYLGYRKIIKNTVLVKTDENPWLIKAVHKFTIDAPLNFQTTFWKLKRFAKIELDKKDNYVKKKKLLLRMLKIFKNRRLKQLELSFIKIETTAGFMVKGGFSSPQFLKKTSLDDKFLSHDGRIFEKMKLVECPSNDSEGTLEKKKGFRDVGKGSSGEEI